MNLRFLHARAPYAVVLGCQALDEEWLVFVPFSTEYKYE
jgi:hypothetical protein